MKRRGFSGGMIVYRSKPNTYYIELWEQPFFWWLLATTYHWYDMRVDKIPFLSRFERWHHRRFGRGDLRFIPLYFRRDLRCYHLTKRGKVVLATLPIDYETYIEIFPKRK